MAAPRHARQPEWVSYVAPVAVAVVAVVVSMVATNS